MAMAVQQRPPLCRREIDIKFSRRGLGGQKFLEQHDPIGGCPRRVAFEQRWNFIAETKYATWLEPDHR